MFHVGFALLVLFVPVVLPCGQVGRRAGVQPRNWEEHAHVVVFGKVFCASTDFSNFPGFISLELGNRWSPKNYRTLNSTQYSPDPEGAEFALVGDYSYDPRANCLPGKPRVRVHGHCGAKEVYDLKPVYEGDLASKSQKQCVCKTKPATSTQSICCDSCHIWFHDVCIGIPAADFERIDKFRCLLCVAKNAKLRTTYKAQPPVKQSTEELVEKLLIKMDSLFDAITKLVGRVDAIEQKVADAPPDRYGQPAADPRQPFDIAAVASQVIADQHVAERKKLRAVLEGIDEQSPEEDVALIRGIAEKCGVAEDLDEEHIHRHGREQQGRGRIIKVPFSSFDSRNKFLRSFASAKKALDLRSKFPKVSARRDLTPLELKTHYSLKQRAYLLNRECGLYKFHYVDLNIVTLSHPKPLRQANVESQVLNESLVIGEH